MVRVKDCLGFRVSGLGFRVLEASCSESTEMPELLET